MSIIQKFADANYRLSERFSHLLGVSRRPEFFMNADDYFVARIERIIEDVGQRKKNSMGAPLRILDIGCGTQSIFAKVKKKTIPYELVGMDISAQDMQRNREITQAIIHDACSKDFRTKLAVYEGSFDVIVTHSFLEHIPYPQYTHAMIRFLLKDDGVVVHSFPTLFDPFLTAAHVLPTGLAKRILFVLEPFRRSKGKFKTYYHLCRGYSLRFEKRLHRLGFQVIDHRNFFGGRYFYRIFILQVFMDLFYHIVMKMNVRFFCSNTCITLLKYDKQDR